MADTAWPTLVVIAARDIGMLSGGQPMARLIARVRIPLLVLGALLTIAGRYWDGGSPALAGVAVIVVGLDCYFGWAPSGRSRREYGCRCSGGGWW